jgi:hypothetical protein
MYRDVLIFQDFSRLAANAVQQSTLSLDASNIDVQRFRNTFFGDAALNRLDDHPVFLDDRDAVDAFFIGECFVFDGDEAHHLGFALSLSASIRK